MKTIIKPAKNLIKKIQKTHRISLLDLDFILNNPVFTSLHIMDRFNPHKCIWTFLFTHSPPQSWMHTRICVHSKNSTSHNPFRTKIGFLVRSPKSHHIAMDKERGELVSLGGIVSVLFCLSISPAGIICCLRSNRKPKRTRQK